MKLFILSTLSFISVFAHCQTFKSSFHIAFIYDNVTTRKIPSYAELHGVPFDVKNEVIRNESYPRASAEFGYKIQRHWKGSKKINTGLILGYRRTSLSYQNQHLYYLKFVNGDVQTIFFAADLRREFLTIQMPFGITLPLSKKFSADFTLRNSLLFSIASSEKARDQYFDVDLASLRKRSATEMLLEISGGVSYTWNIYSLSLKYIHGVTSLYPNTHIAYNELIPSKVYFRSFQLGIEIDMDALVSQDSER